MMIHLSEDGLDYYNPVVEDDGTLECMREELKQREICDYCLYTITPKMTGSYAVAEVVDDSNKRPDRTVLVILTEDGDRKFTEGQLKSLGAVATMVKNNGAVYFDNLKEASKYMSRDK